MDRALGVHWNVEKDTLDFVVSRMEQPENRRGVLSSIATVFDPFGFASPLLLPGREINQELCRLKVDRDMRLPEEFRTGWRDWKEGLVSLEGFGIPRCYRPKGFGELKDVQLHHFAGCVPRTWLWDSLVLASLLMIETKYIAVSSWASLA